MTTSSAGDLEYQKVNKKIGKELSFAFIWSCHTLVLSIGSKKLVPPGTA